MQEANVGKDRLELVRLLQEHRVIVRGGGEEGRRLLTALLVGTLRTPLHCADLLLEWRMFTWVSSAGVETETRLRGFRRACIILHSLENPVNSAIPTTCFAEFTCCQVVTPMCIVVLVKIVKASHQSSYSNDEVMLQLC